MKVQCLLVLIGLISMMSGPVFAHTGANADHSSVTNLLTHLLGFEHILLNISLAVAVWGVANLVALFSQYLSVRRFN